MSRPIINIILAHTQDKVKDSTVEQVHVYFGFLFRNKLTAQKFFFPYPACVSSFNKLISKILSLGVSAMLAKVRLTVAVA